MVRRLLMALAVLTLVVTAAAVAAGCGSDVAGTYKVEGFEAELVLDGDGGFEIVGVNPVDGSEMKVSGTYEVDDDTITFTDESGSGSSTATVEEDAIVIDGQRFEKQ